MEDRDSFPDPIDENPETGRAIYNPSHLAHLPVAGAGSLRNLVRSVYGPASWTTSARKALCLDLLTTGREITAADVTVPGASPDYTGPASRPYVPDGDAAANLAAALQALMPSPALDADAVRDLIREEITPESIGETVQAAVAAAFAAVKPIRLETPSGVVVDCQDQHELFPRLMAHAVRGTRTWVAGPAGSGKTSAPYVVAEALGMQVFLQPPSLTRFDVLGYEDASGRYVDSAVSLWAKHQGPACLLLDEVDSWSEGAQIAANLPVAGKYLPLTGGTTIDIYQSGAPKWIVATANTWGTGPTADYVGRRKMDGSFLNRFSAKLYWGYDEVFETKLALAHADGMRPAAERLVRKIQKARAHCDSKGIKILISPRQTFDAVKALVCKDPEPLIWSEIILGGATADQRSDILQSVGA